MTERDMDQSAGASSPHLDRGEQDQAATHAAPRALVIHEIVREEGELAITRTAGALAWSGLAAGLSMGFSFVTNRCCTPACRTRRGATWSTASATASASSSSS